MNNRPMRALDTLRVLLVALVVMSPSADGQIPKAVEAPYVAPSGKALLVFSRPRRRQASETTYQIVDQAGRCIAVLNNGWQMAAPMWPGKHMLMVITGTAPPTIQLMQAKLTLEAFPAAVREAVLAKPDLRQCTEWVSWKLSKIEPRAEQAKRKWDEASEEHRGAHTVHRNDGWTAAEVQVP
jgi:hypothetical protein